MSELVLGTGRQTTDSLPVGPFPVHSKRGFVGAGFCCAGQQCGGFSGLIKTLHIGGHFTVSMEELGGLVFSVHGGIIFSLAGLFGAGWFSLFFLVGTFWPSRLRLQPLSRLDLSLFSRFLL